MADPIREALERLVTAYDTSEGLPIQEWLQIARAALAAEPLAPAIGPEWRPCVKLPITVHVRDQRPDETHVSTREGITPVRPDDLIMRGVQGEEYPIGRDLFNRTYRLGAADPGGPAPAPAADGEREELIDWLDSTGELAGGASIEEAKRYWRVAALLRQQPIEGVLTMTEHEVLLGWGLIPVVYDAGGGVRIERIIAEDGDWSVRNSRHISPVTGFPTATAAWAALQQARHKEVGDE